MATVIGVHNVRELEGENISGFHIASRTVTSQELLTAVGALDLAAIIIDIDDWNAFGVLQSALEVRPTLVVVGVTSHADTQQVIAAQRAGCSQITLRPLDLQDVSDALRRALGNRGDSAGLGQVFTLLSTTGGAGSTTIACNLAVEIATQSRQKIALFDLDFDHGGVAMAFDQEVDHTIADLARAGAIDAVLLERAAVGTPSGVRIYACPKTLEEAEQIDANMMRSILQCASRCYPYVLLDAPRFLSPITGAAIEHSSKILLVVQLTVPGIRSARRVINALLANEVGLDRIEVIINRYRKNVHNCTLETAAAELGKPLFAVIPSDFQTVHAALDSGRPIEEKNPVRSAIRELAQRLTGQRQVARTGWLSKLGLG